MKYLILLMLALCLGLEACPQEGRLSMVTGPYLGQKPPGMKAQLFAPGIVSTLYFEHSSPVFTPDLKEIYWSTQIEENGIDVAKPILFMTSTGGRWSEPEIPPFARKFKCCENPFITPDGKRLYFSVRDDMRSAKSEIWYVSREGNHWSEPVKLEETINHPQNGAFYTTLANDGTLYFMSLLRGSEIGYGMFVSKSINGRFQSPAPMDYFNRFPAEFAPYIAPDQSFIIFCSFKAGGYGSGDLYVCFKNPDGSWGEIINMGEKINSDLNERFPNVTPDGKYLFFNSTRKIPGAAPNSPGNGQGDIYWIDAMIISELKKNAN